MLAHKCSVKTFVSPGREQVAVRGLIRVGPDYFVAGVSLAHYGLGYVGSNAKSLTKLF